MGNDTSKTVPTENPINAENEEKFTLRWQVTKSTARIKELETENDHLQHQLDIHQFHIKNLEEQLYYPTQYRIGQLYTQCKLGHLEPLEELNELAFGVTGTYSII